MNSKGHLIFSLIKSLMRIIGCVGGFLVSDVSFLAKWFFSAELVGIIEELVDRR